MLSRFPQILFLAPMGTSLLRIVAGLTIIYIAWVFYNERNTVSRMRLPFIGTCPPWLCLFGSVAYFVIGGLLVIGLWTQVAALLGVIVALKSSIYAHRYEKIIPLPLSANLLLLAICLSLVVSGAGLFAFDLPL
ncbi:MAG TPA: hypothetical protein VN495_01140 [Candidatus Paceibacterota bacterium]|nr:hypothetical protein [Candidatus Paceibacterota bacterium]